MARNLLLLRREPVSGGLSVGRSVWLLPVFRPSAG